jgi:actin-related protein
MNEEQAIIVDNGSGFIKAGFAGDDHPNTIFPTKDGKLNQNFLPTKLTFHNPISHGIIRDWDKMVIYPTLKPQRNASGKIFFKKN